MVAQLTPSRACSRTPDLGHQVLVPLHSDVLLLGHCEALGNYQKVFRGQGDTWSAYAVVVRIPRWGSPKRPAVYRKGCHQGLEGGGWPPN